MTIPNTLEGWNYSIIKQLVIDGCHESDTFDFKSVLTSRYKREEYSQALSKCVSAFANTKGGIEDPKNKKGEDRIVGLDITVGTDLPADFGNHVKCKSRN